MSQLKGGTPPKRSREIALRDYFAGCALQGMLTSPGNWWRMVAGVKHHASTFDEYATLAYSAADRMMEERKRK